jgi:hypothetical protein
MYALLCRLTKTSSAALKNEVLNFLVASFASKDYKRGRQYDALHAYVMLREVFSGVDIFKRNFKSADFDLAGAIGLDRVLFKRITHKEVGSHGDCGGGMSVTTACEPYVSFHAKDVSTVCAGIAEYLASKTTDEPRRKHDCPSCGTRNAATATSQDSLRVGKTLMIYVKRFGATAGASKKFHNDVAFELNLDVTSFNHAGAGAGAVGGTSIMTLKKLVMHAGANASVGHYFAYERRSDSTWVKVSDNVVTAVTEADVLGETKRVVFLRYDK